MTGTKSSGIRFTCLVDKSVDFLHREADLVSTLLDALVEFLDGRQLELLQDEAVPSAPPSVRALLEAD